MAASTRLSPEQRIERARNAGIASQSNDALIRRIVDRAPELTQDQLDTLAALLRRR